MNNQPPLFGQPEHYVVGRTSTLLPLRETPAARVVADRSACNTVELLAALIGGPSQIETATLLLTKFGSLSAMQAANVHDVSAVRGVGKQTAARVLAALQIGLRAATETIERKSVNSPADAYHVLRPCFEGKEQEYLFSLLLDTRNRILGEPVEIYHGSLNSTLLRVGEIFREAIKANAASLIIAHNHPSGDPSPSPDDTAVTRLIVEAGRLLDIPLHDHLVIGQNRFVSLKERGLGFS